ncbi:MAG: tetratricopeptide repeat protein, partial [Rhodospirillales bacterium]
MNFAAVVQLFQSGRPAEAEAGCRKILAANPRHADANHLLGILLLQSNRVADASKHLAESVAVRPSDPGAQMALGASLAMQNRIGEALPCFEAAVRLQPVNPDAQYNLALALAKLGRTEEALKGFAKTFAINPRHTGALIGEGVALAELGRYTQAADRFAQADKMAPGQPEILENLCQTLIDAGLIEEAEKALARIPPSQVENRPRSLFLKALLARHRKETDTAVLLFQQLLTKFPDLVEARLNLCSILTEERRFDEADRLIETAASQAPNHPLLPSTRGYLRMKQERYPEAEIDFAKAVEASPGRVHVWKAWQESRLRQGRFTDEVGLHRERPADAPHEAALDKPIQQLGDRIEQIVRPHAADGPTAVFFNPLAIRIGEFCGDFLYLRSVARSLYKKIVVLVPPDPQWINPEALRIVSQGVQVLPLPDQNIHEIAGQYDFGFLRREGIDIGLFSTRYLRRLYFHHRFKGGAMDRFELGTGDLERGREIEKK